MFLSSIVVSRHDLCGIYPVSLTLRFCRGANLLLLLLLLLRKRSSQFFVFFYSFLAHPIYLRPRLVRRLSDARSLASIRTYQSKPLEKKYCTSSRPRVQVTKRQIIYCIARKDDNLFLSFFPSITTAFFLATRGCDYRFAGLTFEQVRARFQTTLHQTALARR